MKPAPDWQDGYTIIEVMIFLVISAVLVLGAIGLFSGRIQRTQFTQAVQALDARVKTTANQAATGTYPNSPGFACNVTASGPEISDGSGQQGTRSECIFAGKIIAPSAGCTAPIATSKCTKIDVYTVVGRRSLPNSQVVDSLVGLNGAKPRVVPAITETIDLTYDTQITGIYQKETPLALDSGVGFFQSFNGNYSNGELASGAQHVQSWFVRSASAIPVSPLTNEEMATAVEDENLTQPAGGTTMICLRSSNNDQKASITIGNTSGSIATNVVIGDPTCP